MPGSGIYSSTLYPSLFQIPSNVYGPVTPTIVDPDTEKVSGNQVVTTNLLDSSTYGMLNRSGYSKTTKMNIDAHFELSLDMGFLTPGLKASGMIAYLTNINNALITAQNYERWVRTDYQNILEFRKKGEDANTTLTYGKSSIYDYHLTYQGNMNYARNFGKHAVTGIAYVFYQNLNQWQDVLPYKRVSSGFEATYEYDQKYLLKFDMGYSGSDQYARGKHRYVATPALSGGWFISKESFMKRIRGISKLKLRASYGKTANDKCNLGRYPYSDNVSYSYGNGPIVNLQYMIQEKYYGNHSIEAEISTKQNYGIDLELFDEFSLSIDVFKEKMNNMIIAGSSYVPSYQGIPIVGYPSANLGKFVNKGYEISLNYRKLLKNDICLSLGGFLNYAKNENINSGETILSDDYAYRNRIDGYSTAQSWGYLVDYRNGNGFFNSLKDIDDSGLSYDIGTPRVGDLIYQDLNHDGHINEKDKAPIGSGYIPRYYYGFSGKLNYKSLDLSFLFQGVGKWSGIYSGMGVYETSLDGVFGSLHRNSWTQERYNNGEKITAPALSLTKSVSHESNDYYNYNRAYLRLKNVSIGYNVKKLAKALSMSQIKFVVCAQNLFTWDNMKSDDFGPEADNYGSIPVYRVYNLGIKIKF